MTAYIEITPRDVIKYELDKPSGLLKVDRVPQTSSSPRTLYGMIPHTHCGKAVAALSTHADVADGDPRDICVFSERPIDKADILLTARGDRRIENDRRRGGGRQDRGGARDPVFDDAGDLNDLPVNMIDRLDHYFRTYKAVPGAAGRVEIEARFGMRDAYAVVEAGIADYGDKFGSFAS